MFAPAAVANCTRQYASPKQRQRWDDGQELPHVNWADLYFDLFYVAAAYQLSHAFKDSPTLEGLLYFVASYLPILLMWYDKLGYNARYAAEDNLFHRSVEIVYLCTLGLLVSYIQPADVMKDTTNNPTMVVCTGAYFCCALFLAYLYFDVSQNVVGGPEAVINAWYDCYRKLSGALFYGVAFLFAANDYFFLSSTKGIVLGGETRNDGAEEEGGEGNYWPAYFMILGYFTDMVLFSLVMNHIVIPRRGLSHREAKVPLNIEYTIHRFGEWVMLMLGESVLSILTIPQTQYTFSISYVISFFAGILTVTMFQYLFFRTQPSESNDHATRRSPLGGYLLTYWNTFFSAALILVGCSYKMMLSEQEMLAQAEEQDVDYDMRERIALVYAVSQAVSFLTLDLMILSHRGVEANFGRFRMRRSDGTVQCAIVPTTVACMNILLIGLTICLSFVRDMTLLSGLGCLLVFCQVLLRATGL